MTSSLWGSGMLAVGISVFGNDEAKEEDMKCWFHLKRIAAFATTCIYCVPYNSGNNLVFTIDFIGTF